MTNNTPSGAKKHRESTEPELESPDGQNVFLSSSSSSSFSFSSDGLVQICFTLSRWFSHKTAAFFTEHAQCTSPSLSSMFEVTRGDWSFEPLSEELWLPLRRHFFFPCTHAHKSLSNQMQLLRKIAELEILLVCREYLKKAWSVILEPILHRKPVRGDLLLCNRWQASAQAWICC